MPYTFHVLTTQADMLPLYPLFRQLNPSVAEDRYQLLLQDMVQDGYRMVVILEGATSVALAGIWVGTKLYSGKYLEMDNVVVAETHRSKGIGHLLSTYIRDLALAEGCETMMLDAYLENDKAHAFYERFGFVRRGYHFVIGL